MDKGFKYYESYSIEFGWSIDSLIIPKNNFKLEQLKKIYYLLTVFCSKNVKKEKKKLKNL